MPWKKVHLGDVVFGSVIRVDGEVFLYLGLANLVHLPSNGYWFRHTVTSTTKKEVEVFETKEKISTVLEGNGFSFLRAIADIVHKGEM